MDAEDTAGYREACVQCGSVDWGLWEEAFYCRTCHTGTQRSRDVEDTSFSRGSSRVSTLGSGVRGRRTEGGREWSVCEGFQFILTTQADALLALGVGPAFKEQVLWELWRRYLQKSGQAYTHKPARGPHFKLDSDTSSRSSVLGSDRGTSASDFSTYMSASSASVDDITARSSGRRSHRAMSMRKTLALLHLALLWSREALTLSDLLRLVHEGHVPYADAFQQLPDEMMEGKQAVVFRVESVPSHSAVHREAEVLLGFLQLPSFPPISSHSLLHPCRLSLRYLLDANLPVDLHPVLCRLMEVSGSMSPQVHTCGGSSRPAVPLYDAKAAALIIVTMKLLFGLDDQTEWDLSSQATEDQDAGDQFSVRRWYRLLQAVLIRAQTRKKVEVSRKQWKANKCVSVDRKDRRVVMKRKRTAEQLRACYEKLSSRSAAGQQLKPSSFRFCWGEQRGADGPSFHQKKLAGGTLRNSWYWHPALKRCKPRTCRGHYREVNATLPQTFRWFLQLFSFLLDITPACLYEEVLNVERDLFSSHTWTSEPLRSSTLRQSRDNVDADHEG